MSTIFLPAIQLQVNMDILTTNPATETKGTQTDLEFVYPPAIKLSDEYPLTPPDAFASTSEVANAMLTLVIRNFSKMTDTIYGPPVGIRGLPWRIMVMPRIHTPKNKKCLGFFVQCVPSSFSDSWTVQADAELSVCSYITEKFTRTTSHVYNNKENDWGYSCFMFWSDIVDPTKGYIHNDTVRLEIVVSAEKPKNIIDHETFRKKILEYVRLADVQSERGLLDKAIDVNASAAKFCQNKDNDLCEALETQRKRLIDLKLKESIARLETVSKTPSEDKVSSGNQLAVRKAILSLASTKKANGAAARTGRQKKTATTTSAAIKPPPTPPSDPNSTLPTVVDPASDNFPPGYTAKHLQLSIYVDQNGSLKTRTNADEFLQTHQNASCQTEHVQIPVSVVDAARAQPTVEGYIVREIKKAKSHMQKPGSKASSSATNAQGTSEAEESNDPEPTSLLVQSVLKKLPKKIALQEMDVMQLAEYLHELAYITVYIFTILSEIDLGGKAYSLVDLIKDLKQPIEYDNDVLDYDLFKESEPMPEFPSERTSLPEFIKKLMRLSDFFTVKFRQFLYVYRNIDIKKLKFCLMKRLSMDAKDVEDGREHVLFLEEQLHSATICCKRFQTEMEHLSRENKSLIEKVKFLKEKQHDLDSLRAAEKENEALKASLKEAEKKICDLQSAFGRERQSYNDSKANLQRENQALLNDVKSAKGLLEDMRASCRRAETQLATERKFNAAALKAEKERACRAEISLLDCVLVHGLRILERARVDSQTQVKAFNNVLSALPLTAEVERDVMKRNMNSWIETFEEVATLIADTHQKYKQHVDQLKSGKTLAQLEKFVVPSPPPPPKMERVPSPEPQRQRVPPPAPPPGMVRRGSQPVIYSNPTAYTAPPPPVNMWMSASRPSNTGIPPPYVMQQMPPQFPPGYQNFNVSEPVGCRPSSSSTTVKQPPRDDYPIGSSIHPSSSAGELLQSFDLHRSMEEHLSSMSLSASPSIHTPGVIGDHRRKSNPTVSGPPPPPRRPPNSATDSGFYDLFSMRNDIFGDWLTRIENLPEPKLVD